MLSDYITSFSINSNGKKYEINIFNRNSNSCNRHNNRLSSSLHLLRFKFSSTTYPHTNAYSNYFSHCITNH